MNELQVTSMLVEGIEHVPAGSIRAHRARGVRGQLLRIVEQIEGA